MKLRSLRIQNFRAFTDETIEFGAHVALVGANGAGKSTVLAALNVLFRNTAGAATDVVRLDQEDFHNKNTSSDVVISATFHELTPEAEADLAHYVRQGTLIVTCRARWDASAKAAEVKQHGSRLLVPAFQRYYEQEEAGAAADALKAIYSDLRTQYTDLPLASTKPKMKAALDEYSTSHPSDCEALESADQFYGFSRGTNRLERYLQWVYVPAVKEASSEQQEGSKSALGALLQRSVRATVDFDSALGALRTEAWTKYQEILDERQSALDDLAGRLRDTLRQWSHPDATIGLRWEGDPQRSVAVLPPSARADLGEESFSGHVARMGHGLQRSFILSLLQVLATDPNGAGPTLLLGIEEPELYQHPPQARHFARVLRDLAAQGTQVIVTTHSPHFVSAREFDRIRLVRRRTPVGDARVSHAVASAVDERVAQALGHPPTTGSDFLARLDPILGATVAEMFFCRIPLFVEGPGDVALLSAWLEVRGRADDFRRHGFHLVNCNGKVNASRPVAIARELDMPFFVVFDGDKRESKPDEEAHRVATNRCLLSLGDHGLGDPTATSTSIGTRVVMWGGTIESVIRAAVGDEAWMAALGRARATLGVQASTGVKNPVVLAEVIQQLVAVSVRIEPLEHLEAALFSYAGTLRPD